MRTLKGGSGPCRSNNCGFIGHRVTRGSESWGCQAGNHPSQSFLRGWGDPAPGLSSTMSSLEASKKHNQTRPVGTLQEEPCPGLGYPLLPRRDTSALLKRAVPSTSPRGWRKSCQTKKEEGRRGLSPGKTGHQTTLGFTLPSLGQEVREELSYL